MWRNSREESNRTRSKQALFYCWSRRLKAPRRTRSSTAPLMPQKHTKNENFPVKHQLRRVLACFLRRIWGCSFCSRVCRDRSHISRQGKKALLFLNSGFNALNTELCLWKKEPSLGVKLFQTLNSPRQLPSHWVFKKINLIYRNIPLTAPHHSQLSPLKSLFGIKKKSLILLKSCVPGRQPSQPGFPRTHFPKFLPSFTIFPSSLPNFLLGFFCLFKQINPHPKGSGFRRKTAENWGVRGNSEQK